MSKQKRLTSISLILLHIIFNSFKTYSSPPLLKITGTIHDAITNESLPQASIVLFDKITTKFIKAELSTIDGSFQLQNLNSGNYKLLIQYIGYEEYKIDSLVLTEDIEIKSISLIPIQKKLSEINVTAVKPIIEQTANTTVVNISESTLAAGSNAYDILQRIPGINAKNDKLSVRGKPISLLLNGRLINIPEEEMISILKSLSGPSIEKIELITNPTGKYDGQVQAIVNIKTLKPKDDLWGGAISLGVGMARKMRTTNSINIYYKKNKLAFTSGVDFTIYGLKTMFRKTVPYTLPNANFTLMQYQNDIILEKETSLRMDINYAIHPYHSIGLAVRPTFNPQKIESTTIITLQPEKKEQADSLQEIISNRKADFNNLNGNIYYQTTFDSIKNKELIINIDHYRYTKSWLNTYNLQIPQSGLVQEDNSSLRLNENPVQITIQSATADYTQKTSIGKWQTGLKTSWVNIANQSIWKTYNGTNWEINSTLSDYYRYAEIINAFYGGFSGNFKKINVDVFCRIEHTYNETQSAKWEEPMKRAYNTILPSINIQYNPSDKHEWIFSYRKNITRPSYQDLNPFLRTRSLYYYSQGNPFLLPVVNHSAEVAYGYKQKFFIQLNYQQNNYFIYELIRQFESVQAWVTKKENFSNSKLWRLNFITTQSLFSWCQISATIAPYYYKLNHPEVPSQPTRPALEASFSSSIGLPHNWTIESSGFIDTQNKNGFVNYSPNYGFNLGVKKTFLENQLTTSFLLSFILPYWNKYQVIYSQMTDYLNYDLRYGMITISYKIGSINKSGSKSGIDVEKNRIKE